MAENKSIKDRIHEAISPKQKIRAWLDECPSVTVWVAAYGPQIFNMVRGLFAKRKASAK